MVLPWKVLKNAAYNRAEIFLHYFGGPECVGHSFAYVAHFYFIMDVWIQTQSAVIPSKRTINLATLEGGFKEGLILKHRSKILKMSEQNHQPTYRNREMPCRTNLILRSFENHISCDCP